MADSHAVEDGKRQCIRLTRRWGGYRRSIRPTSRREGRAAKPRVHIAQGLVREAGGGHGKNRQSISPSVRGIIVFDRYRRRKKVEIRLAQADEGVSKNSLKKARRKRHLVLRLLRGLVNDLFLEG